MGRLITLKNLSNIQVSIEPEYVNESGNKTLRLIDTLCYIVNNTFKIDEKPLIIIFNKNADTPVYLSEQGTITLTAGIDQYATIIYQLSHELCHFGMVNPVPSHMKWFEESICEVASYYFLLKMAKLYHLKYLATKEEKYKRYMEFVATYSRQSESFKIFSTGDLVIGKDKALLDVLQKNEKLREYNRYIAIKILPVFQTNPQLWECIQYLGSVDAEHPYAFLLQWNTICQKNIGIDVYEIIQTLGWSNILRI